MMPVRNYNGQTWLPNLFNDFFDNDWMVKVNAHSPAVNVIESDVDYKVEVAAPGMKKEDFTVNLSEDNELVICLEKKTENKEEKKNCKYLRREFSYAKFRQSFVLPDDVDKEHIAACVTDGVLAITLPKRSPEDKVKVNRNIEVQ